ncbi:alpha/beta fold hydrolase [Streptomyces sp. NPDC059994]|uniref:alpha/beta fold hydrolase n=1 Tax=Streptomyces sp. NPDC059994 TaxID=3347029 RepID=UPI00369FDD1C
MFYRPGCQPSRIACPLLVLVCDQDQSALPGPPADAARQAPRGELARMPGGHYEPFLDGHERAADTELAFLFRHLPTDPAPHRPAPGTDGATL